MWRTLGVAGIWILLISAPHLGSPAAQVNVAGVAPGTVPVMVAEGGDAGVVPEDEPIADAHRAKPDGGIASTQATVHFKNVMGKTLGLLGATVTMDGKPLPPVTNLDTDDDTVLFAGPVAAGEHVFDTQLLCQGERRGPFTYLDAYKWQVTSRAVLRVPEGKTVVFTIAATRSSGVNVPFDQQVRVAVSNEVLPSPSDLELR